MKKLTSLLLAALLVFTCSVCALADGAKYETPDEMYRAWLKDGFPDYVCGAWYSDETNSLTVAVLGESYANTINNMIADITEGFTVTWGSGYTHSHNELEAIQREVCDYMSNKYELAAASVSIDEQGNRVIVDLTGDGDAMQKITAYLYSHYDNTVWVAVTDEVLKGAPATNGKEPFVPDYDPTEFDGLPAQDDGAFATFQTSDADPVMGGAVEPGMGVDAGSARHFNPAWLMLIFLPLLAGGYALITRRSAALQTNAGTVVAGSVMSTKDVENAVRSSTMEAPSTLDDKMDFPRK